MNVTAEEYRSYEVNGKGWSVFPHNQMSCLCLFWSGSHVNAFSSGCLKYNNYALKWIPCNNMFLDYRKQSQVNSPVNHEQKSLFKILSLLLWKISLSLHSYYSDAECPFVDNNNSCVTKHIIFLICLKFKMAKGGGVVSFRLLSNKITVCCIFLNVQK